MHSEFNGSDKENVHFLQMWVKQNVHNTKPNYQTKSYPESMKSGGQLALIVAPSAEDTSSSSSPCIVKADIRVYAGILKPGESLKAPQLVDANREAYIHVIQDVTGLTTEANQSALNVNGVTLQSGDGAFLTKVGANSKAEYLQLTGAGKSGAATEFLLFDIAKAN
jgi:redox-sensitive bicupin YhaK (pirin superfamily)